MTERGGVSADLIARAIVAAAISYGDDPTKAMTASSGQLRRAVSAACEGLQRQTGLPLKDVARLFGVAPSTVCNARVRSEEGFTKAAEAARRAVEFAGWRPEAAVSRVDANAVRTPPRLRAPKPAAVPMARRPAPKDFQPLDGVAPAKPAVVHRSMARAVSHGCDAAPVPVSAMRYAIKAQRPAHAPMSARVERVRPVTPRTVRFARRFMASNAWEIEEVAELFGVTADDLAAALGMEAAS